MTTDHTSGSIPDREVGSHLRVPQNWQFAQHFHILDSYNHLGVQAEQRYLPHFISGQTEATHQVRRC